MNKDNHLDNSIWEALNGRQAKFAIKGKNVLRYRPDIFVMAGIPDTSKITIENLSDLIQKGSYVGLMGFKINMEPHFKQVFGVQAYQMVTDKIPEYKTVEYVELSKEDTQDIAELVKLTEPGPYAPNVLELGKYIGIIEEGKLVAMLGERIKLDGYTEVSLVCTHPDHRGKGYAKSLSGIIIEEIINRGETPFLHVMTHNVPAYNLYEKLGFKTRVEYPITVYNRL
jgi:ribosomal protein S18 acetylase RimI-like enzyme